MEWWYWAIGAVVVILLLRVIFPNRRRGHGLHSGVSGGSYSGDSSSFLDFGDSGGSSGGESSCGGGGGEGGCGGGGGD